MRLPVPGPAALLGGASALAEAAETALGLVPRAAEAMTRVEELLDRVEAVVDGVDRMVARTDVLLGTAEEASARSLAMVGTAEIVTRDAGRVTAGAQGVLDRADTALSTWEPVLRSLAPSAKRFADALDPAEVTAAIALVDRMPALLDHVEQDVLPMLQQLDRVGPDVHEVLEVVQDLRRVVTGLPGIGLLRRRGDDEPPPVEGSLHDTQDEDEEEEEEKTG